MLTIREPIQLKNKDIVRNGDGFSKALLDNYNKADADLSAEELLHLVTTPPEVVYAEGDNHNFFTSNISALNITEQRTQILNNLVNRILLNAEGHMTYQDRVYVSQYLTKLGITNQQTFMKSVREVLKEHTESIHKLSDMSERLEVLRESAPQIVSELSKRARESENSSTVEKERLYLHERIYDRLKTSRIYDTLWKFKENNSSREYISPGQLRLTEQHKISRYIELNRLQTRVLGTSVPMEFYHQDIYEQQISESLETLTEEEIKQTLTQATLLSLVEQVYETRDNYIDNHKHITIDAGDLYSIASNTIDRYVDNLYSPQVYHTTYNTEISNVASQVLEYLETQTEAAETAIPTEEQIYQDIRRIEQTNIESRNRYILAMQQLEQKLSEKKPEKPSLDRQRRESLEALENPVELMHRIETENTERIERETILRKEAIEQMSPTTRRYIELIDKYIVNPTPEDRAFMEHTDPFAQLTRDIAQVQMENAVVSQEQIDMSEETKTVLTEAIRHIKGEEEHLQTNISTDSFAKKINLVHKQTETVNEEEIVERIEEIRNMNRESSVKQNETVEETTLVNRNISSTQIVGENIDQRKIIDIVRTQMAGQMGEISDQVFRRLENRLANEKRRRGY